MGICFGKKNVVKAAPYEIDYKVEQLHLPAPKFSLKNQTCLGECVSVYDGDTARFNILTSIGVHQWAVRISHYDSPEIKGVDLEEKVHARACRDLMKDLILGKVCVIQCGDFEKYGRLLGEIYVPYDATSNPISTYSATSSDLEHVKSLLDIQHYMMTRTPSQSYEGGKKQDFVYKNFHSSDPRYNTYCEKYTKDIMKK